MVVNDNDHKYDNNNDNGDRSGAQADNKQLIR